MVQRFLSARNSHAANEPAENESVKRKEPTAGANDNPRQEDGRGETAGLVDQQMEKAS
jgi:hypothetical protein